MLNEFLEFEACIDDPVSASPRVQPKLLTNGYKKGLYALNGIDQVLVILLRWLLFSSDAGEIFDGDGMITQRGIDTAAEFLNIWCGFEDMQDASSPIVRDRFREFPRAAGWLRNFWIFHYRRLRKTGTEEEASKEWEALRHKWDGKLNSDLDYQAGPVTFRNMIADALQKGPLRERYCIIRKREGYENVKSISDLYDRLFKSDENPQERMKLRFLRNIIAFRIFAEDHPGKQDEVLLQKLRLFGWYGVDDEGRTKSWCPDRFYREDHAAIMQGRSEKDYAKFRIDEEYLKHFGFLLIDPSEAESYRKDWFVLRDRGHGDDRPLELLFM